MVLPIKKGVCRLSCLTQRDARVEGFGLVTFERQRLVQSHLEPDVDLPLDLTRDVPWPLCDFGGIGARGLGQFGIRRDLGCGGLSGQ